MTRLYNTQRGPLLETGDRWTACGESFDRLVTRGEGLHARLVELARSGPEAAAPPPGELLPPIGSQELWGAGVTYHRSRTARMHEAAAAGGASFYDRVYQAARPELFLKATPSRVVGHRQAMRLRRDSRWIVPEPELTLLVGPDARILGYTIGNDLSCRDIEGENPLYLPQAKTYDRCAAIGPGILISDAPLPGETRIDLEIRRAGAPVFSGGTTVDQIKRPFDDLLEHLFRETSFPAGCLLMTGTGVIPPDDFSVQAGDEVHITIEPIGTLTNWME